MGNQHREKNNNIPELTYSKIIESMINIQKGEEDKKYKARGKENLILGVDVLAYKVMQSFKETNFEDIIDVSFLEHGNNITSTLNFIDSDLENKKIKELIELLRPVVDNLTVSPDKLENYMNFSGNRPMNIGLKSVFAPVKSNVECVSYNVDSKDSILTHDSIEIYQNIENLEADIEKSLIHLFSKDIEDEDELNRIKYKIQNHDYLVNKIKDFIITYRDGHIKRLIEGPLYLDFIRDLINEKEKYFTENDSKAFSLFKTYVDRIKALDKFVQDSIIEEDEDVYKIEYLNSEFDFLRVLKMEDFYDMLPFSGSRTSPLVGARKTSRTEGLEIYGASLKLNGAVQSKSFKTSFEYHYNTLKEASNGVFYKNEKQTERPSKSGSEFKKALIFKYMLLNLEDDNYDALCELKSDLKKYKESEINSKNELISAINDLTKDIVKDVSKIKYQLSLIKDLLTNYLDKNNDVFEKKYTKRFSILKSILPEDIDSNDGVLLENVDVNGSNKKFNILNKYTILLDDEINPDYCVYSYEYDILISSKPIGRLEDRKTIEIGYDTKYQKPFSVVFYPKNSKDIKLTNDIKDALNQLHKELDIEKYGENKPMVYIPYPNIDFFNDEKDRFVYETAYMIAVSIIISELNKKIARLIPGDIDEKIKNKYLYLMILQLTANPESRSGVTFNKMQTFIKKYRKVLASIYSHDYTCEAQGFNVLGNMYKARNGVSSLFSKVYREADFKKPLNKIDKLAIITASSRKVDGSSTSQNESNNIIHGEVITVMQKKKSEKYRISFFEEFADVISKDDLYKEPIVLSDIITRLKSLGYKNIIFLASSPSTSNMIEKKEKTEMYFMNEEVMNTIMKDNEGVNIYPMYMTMSKAHFSKNERDKSNTTIFVAKGKELSSNIKEDYEGIVPLFQLFSGNVIDAKSGFYKQMITYSTIKGIYSDETKKLMGNIDLAEDCQLIDDIRDIMTAIHIIRNDKDESKPNAENKNLFKVMKNNPFDNILPGNNNSNGNCIGVIGNEIYELKGSRNNNKRFSNHKLALCNHISKLVNCEK